MNGRSVAASLLVLTMAAVGAAASTADLWGIAGSASDATAAGTAGTVRYAASTHTAWFPATGLGGVSAHLRGVGLDEAGYYYVVGETGTLLRSTLSGGHAFILETTPTEEHLHGAAYFNSRMMVSGGGGVLLWSANPGGAWSLESTPTSQTLYALVRGLSCGIAVGAQGTILRGGVDGTGWTAVSSPVTGADLHGVVRLADNRFLAVGTGGTVLRSPAAGTPWEVISFPESIELFGVAARTGSPARVVAVGEGGAIYTSTDAGSSWQEVESSVTRTLRAVAYTGSDFLACGDHGTLLRSQDGVTWSDLTPVRRSSWGALKRRFQTDPATEEAP